MDVIRQRGSRVREHTPSDETARVLGRALTSINVQWTIVAVLLQLLSALSSNSADMMMAVVVVNL